MQEFEYTAKKGPSAVEQGSISAESREMAVEKLTSQGFFVLRVKPKSKTIDLLFHRTKISISHKIDFYTRLLAYSQAGLDLVESLEIIYEEGVGGAFDSSLKNIILSVKNGISFSTAVSDYPLLFDKISQQLLLAGEQTGEFEFALSSIIELTENKYKLRQIISQAVIYPLFVLVSSFLLITLLLVFVLPRLSKMFFDMGSDLPLITRLVLQWAEFSKSFFLPIILLVFLCFAIAKFFFKNIQLRAYLELVLFKSKVISTFLLLIDSHRFTTVIASMLKSDVSLQDSLTMASGVVVNQSVAKEIISIRDFIIAGGLLSQALLETRLKQFIAVRLVKVGEKTGRLPQTFFSISQILEQRLNNLVVVLSRLLEPMLIVFVGVVVAIIILALVLPVLNMTNLLV